MGENRRIKEERKNGQDKKREPKGEKKSKGERNKDRGRREQVSQKEGQAEAEGKQGDAIKNVHLSTGNTHTHTPLTAPESAPHTVSMCQTFRQLGNVCTDYGVCQTLPTLS